MTPAMDDRTATDGEVMSDYGPYCEHGVPIDSLVPCMERHGECPLCGQACGDAALLVEHVADVHMTSLDEAREIIACTQPTT